MRSSLPFPSPSDACHAGYLMLLIYSRLNLADPDSAMLWAAFSTARFGFLRVSEFTTPPSGFDPSVHPSISCLAVDCHHRTSGVLRLIKASKTVPFSQGVRLLLPRTGGALASLSAYLHRRGNSSGPLFLFADGKPFPRLHVTDRLSSILAEAGIQGNFSSHSIRISAATSSHAAGLPDSLIRTLGPKSHVTLRQAAGQLASSSPYCFVFNKSTLLFWYYFACHFHLPLPVPGSCMGMLRQAPGPPFLGAWSPPLLRLAVWSRLP